MSWRQLTHTLINGHRRRYVVVPHVCSQRSSIDDRFPAWIAQESAKLRGKGKAVFQESIVKRLFTNAISYKHKLLFIPIPYGKGEHADEFANTSLDTPLIE